MIIKLNDKEMTLNFGIRFIRECDERTKEKMTFKGITQEFSEGLTKYVGGLLNGKATDLISVIDCALWKHKGEYTEDDLYDWFDNLEDSDAIFEQVISELERSNASKKEVAQAKVAIEKQKEEAEKIHSSLMSE